MRLQCEFSCRQFARISTCDSWKRGGGDGGVPGLQVMTFEAR